MGSLYAGETGIAAAGAIKVGQVRGWMSEEGAADQVADAAGFEGAGGLQVFKFEEDAAGCLRSALWGKAGESGM